MPSTVVVVVMKMGRILSRALSSFLYETQPTDPGVFAAVSLVFVLTGLAACYVPARRGMGVDPLVALRDE